jgi:hypothetical protein
VALLVEVFAEQRGQEEGEKQQVGERGDEEEGLDGVA